MLTARVDALVHFLQTRHLQVRMLGGTSNHHNRGLFCPGVVVHAFNAILGPVPRGGSWSGISDELQKGKNIGSKGLTADMQSFKFPAICA